MKLTKQQSRAELHKAISRGGVIRPDVCESCGHKVSRIEGHHEDYQKPLDVQWLCSHCHSAVTPKVAPYTYRPRPTVKNWFNIRITKDLIPLLATEKNQNQLVNNLLENHYKVIGKL